MMPVTKEVVCLVLFLGYAGFNAIKTEKQEAAVEKTRVEYLESDLPYLKNNREAVQYQISVCNRNIESLQQMYRDFKEVDSKEQVRIKLESIKAEKEKLKVLLSKINTEVERGLILRKFNSIEEGGLRIDHLKSIDAEASTLLSQAKRANAYIESSFKH